MCRLGTLVVAAGYKLDPALIRLPYLLKGLALVLLPERHLFLVQVVQRQVRQVAQA